MAGVQPSKFINYVSEFKKLLVTRNNGTITQKFKVDSNITDDYYFSIVNNKNQLVNLTGRSFKIYGSLIDAKDDLHILFYSNTADISQNGTEMHFKINTYTSQYLQQIKTNKIIDLTIIEVVQPQQGQESQEEQITQVILRDQAIAYKRPYIDNVQPTEIVYKVLLTANTPLTGCFGSGQDITLTYGSNGAAFGTGLEQTGNNQLVIGKYNEADNTKVFVIGNGSNDTARSNLLTIDYSGNIATNGALSATAVYINGQEVGTQVDQKLEATSGWVNETFETKDASTSAYNRLEQDVSDVDSKVDNLSSVMTANYATKVELGAVADAIPSKVSELENDSKYVTSAVVDGYATEQWVLDKQYITSSEIPTDYVTNGQLDEAISSFITIEDVPVYTGSGAVVVDQNHVISLTGQLGKTYNADNVTLELDQEDNTFSIKSVREKITAGEGISLSTNTDTGVTTISLFGSGTPGEAVQYYEGTGISIDNYTISINQNWLDAQIPTKVSQLNNDLAFVPSSYLATYATKAELPTVPTNVGAFTNDVGYLTAHQSLADYYTKTQTDSEIATATDDMATKTWVGQQGFLVQASLADYATKTYVDNSISGFAEQDTVVSVSGTLADNIALKANSADVYNKTEVDNAITAATSTFITEADIPTKVSDFENDSLYVTSGELTGALNAYTKTNDLTDYISTNILTGFVSNQQLEAKEYATTGAVDTASTSILNTLTSDYATKTSVTSEIEAASSSIENWADAKFITEHQSLSSYYTKSEVDSAIGTATNDMATETWVAGQISGKANKNDVYTIAEANAAIETATSGKANSSSLNNYYTKTEADNKFLTGHQSLDNYYTKSQVYTKAQTDSAIDTATDDMATKTWVTNKHYATTSDLPTVPTNVGAFTNDVGYVNSSYVANKIAELDQDTKYRAGDGLVLSTNNTFILTANIPSIQGLASETYVNNAVSSKADKSELTAYLTAVPSEYITQNELSTELTGYAKTSDIPSVEGFATESELEEVSGQLVNAIGAKANTTDLQNYVQTSTMSAYATSAWVDQNYVKKGEAPTDVYTKAEVNTISTTLSTSIVAQIPSVDGLASEQYVTGAINTASTAIVGQIPDTSDLVDNTTLQTVSAAIVDQIPSTEGLATEADLQIVSAAIPSLNGYATENFVTSQGYITSSQIPAEYVTESELASEGFLKSVPSEYITDSELSSELTAYAKKSDLPTVPTKVSELENDVPYLSAHQSLADYATIQYVDDVSSAISTAVDNAGYLTEHQSLSSYYTKDEVNSAIGTATTDMATETWVGQQNFLKSVPTTYVERDELTSYAQLSDIPSVQGLASEQYVDTAINALSDVYAKTTDIPTVPTNVSDFTNDAGYVTSTVVDGYATEQWVEDKHYLTGVDLTDYALKSEIPTDNSELANTCGYITSSDIPTNVSVFTNDAGYITDAALADYAKTSAVQAVDDKLSAYALTANVYNKTEVDDKLANKADESSLSDYIAWTASGNFATSAQLTALTQTVDDKADLSTVQTDYALKSELPVVSTYVAGNNVSITSTGTNEYTVAATDTTYVEGTGVTISGASNIIAVDQEWLEGFVANLGYLPVSSNLDVVADEETIVMSVDDGRVLSVNTTWLNNLIDGKGFATTGLLSSTSAAIIDLIPTVPTNVSVFTNDAGYLVSSDLSDYAKSADVTTEINTATTDMATTGYVTGVVNDLATGAVATNTTNIGQLSTDLTSKVTSSDVKTQVEAYQYQNATQVASIVEGYNYATNTTVNGIDSRVSANETAITNLSSTKIDATSASGIASGVVQNYITVSGLATEDYVNGQIAQIPAAAEYDAGTGLQRVFDNNTNKYVFNLTGTVLTGGTDIEVVGQSINFTGHIPTDAEMSGVVSNVLTASGVALTSDIPTVVSDLTNDAGYITGIPTSYVQQDDLTGYAQLSDIPTVPTNVGDFTNNVGYLTAVPVADKEAISGAAVTSAKAYVDDKLTAYALSSDVYNKTEVYTKSEADNKFLTAHQDLTDYAQKTWVEQNFLSSTASTVIISTASGLAKDYVDGNNYLVQADLNGYATTGLLSSTSATLTTSIKAVDDKFVNYTTTTDLASTYETKADTSTLCGQLSAAISGKADSSDIPVVSTYSAGTNISITPSGDNNFEVAFTGTIPSIEGLASEEYVNTVSTTLSTNIVAQIPLSTATSAQVSSIVEGYGYITGIADNALLSDIKTYKAGEGLALSSDNQTFYLTGDYQTGTQVSAIASAYASEATPSVDTICGMLSSANENLTISKSDNKILFTAAAGGSSYSAGDYISLTNDTIAVTGLPGQINYISSWISGMPSGGYTAGEGVTIENGVIASTGGGGSSSGPTNKQLVSTGVVYDPTIEIYKNEYTPTDSVITLGEFTVPDGSLAENEVATFEEWVTTTSAITGVVTDGVILIGELPSAFTNKYYYIFTRIINSNGDQFIKFEYEFTTDKYLTMPLTIKAINGPATVSFEHGNSASNIALDCSVDGGEWTAYTMGSGVTLAEGHTIAFSGNNTRIGLNTQYGAFYTPYANHIKTSNGNIIAYGNAQSLIGYNQATAIDALAYLFGECTGIVDASKVKLPAITIARTAYQNMFLDCKSLTGTPQLPATTLGNGCYYQMFRGCTSLSTALQLPASTLTPSCYNYMFAFTNLTGCVIQATNATANNCTIGMFQGCSSIQVVDVNFTSWWPLNTESYNNWFSSSSTPATGTFRKPSALPNETGYDRIPTGWTVVNKD